MKQADNEKDEIEITVINFWAFFQINEINQRSDCEDTWKYFDIQSFTKKVNPTG